MPPPIKNAVRCVAAASDGHVFIGSDNFVNVHDLRSLRVKAHTAEVKAVATADEAYDRLERLLQGVEARRPRIHHRGGQPCALTRGDADGAHFVVGISCAMTASSTHY